jgi:hypothetical protein
MKIVLIAYVLICSLFSSNILLEGTLRIVSTAALISDDYSSRKSEYIESILRLNKFGYDPYIIEAILSTGPSFLDDYCQNVFYSKAHDFSVTDIRNKGINEARTLIDGLNYFDFHPDDMIIKLTGRYLLKSDQFIKQVENNPDIDVFIKYIHLDYIKSPTNEDGSWPITAIFAMRFCYMIEMLESLDYQKMEQNFSYLENEVYKYLERKLQDGSGIRIKQVPILNLTARVIGDGRPYSFEL